MNELLLIEDDENHAEIIQFYIESYSQKITVTHLNDGEQAMDYLARFQQQNKSLPWLILLDLNLPRYNGHEILQRIKQTQQLQYIPTVIFSTSDSSQDIEQALQHHANSYYQKPLALDGFEDCINQILDYWSNNQHTTLLKRQTDYDARH